EAETEVKKEAPTGGESEAPTPPKTDAKAEAGTGSMTEAKTKARSAAEPEAKKVAKSGSRVIVKAEGYTEPKVNDCKEWTEFRNYEYKLFSAAKTTWRRHEAQCNREGGHLASIQSAQEHFVLEGRLIASISPPCRLNVEEFLRKQIRRGTH
ncbi:hypothetical protein Tcan_01337, partial [Toxocara canis]